MAKSAAKISDIIVELGAEIASLNSQIDAVNAEIRANENLPPAREEIEAELVSRLDQGAARYKEALRFEFRQPFRVKHGHRQVHDGLDVLRLQPLTYGVAPATDFQLLGDAFAWLVKQLGQPAIDDLMQSAPQNGILRADKAANDVQLKAKKRALEVRLEETHVELERAGMRPERRPDLSPEVFLDFKSKRDWDKGKFESFREAHIGDRAARSRLQEKRNDLTYKIGRLQQEIANRDRGEYEKSVEQKIATLSEERKAMDEKMAELKLLGDKRAKLFNRCIDYLREQGVEIDHHL